MVLVVLPEIQNSLLESQEIINQVIQLMPFVAVAGMIITVLNMWINSYDDIPIFDSGKLKFWEWKLKRYFLFIFILMWSGSILDKSMGFVFSICLFWITLYKIIREYDIWVKKEENKKWR